MPYITPTELSNLQGKIDTLENKLEQMTVNAERERLEKDKLLRACKEVYLYLDQPQKSEYGNVEIINFILQAIQSIRR